VPRSRYLLFMWHCVVYTYCTILCAVNLVLFDVVLTAELVLVQPHIMHIITFIEVIATDQDHSESNVSSACGLVG